MSKPEVTVLMAVYNGGRYLKESVESVLAQTYKDFEFLIINDRSTDDTAKTITSFGDERIRLHTNAENLGQTRSLNIGFKMASGEYIARIDADDVALPHWLEVQVEQMRRQPDYSVISSYAFAVNEHNRIKKLYKLPQDRESLVLRALIASPINHVGSIINKRHIIDQGGYDEKYVTAADYALWSVLLKNALKITTTPQILVAIREHSGSLTKIRQGDREINEIMSVVRANLEAFACRRMMDEELRLFCWANYGPEGLTDAEFAEAIRITKDVYGHLPSSVDMGDRERDRWMSMRCKTLYLKRIFSAIGRKDYIDARTFSRKGMREFGMLSIFSALWILSLLGGAFLGLIPALYDHLLRQKAYWQIAFKVNTNTFR